MASKPVIGILGGSGLYEIEELSNVEEVSLQTPFGDERGLHRVQLAIGRQTLYRQYLLARGFRGKHQARGNWLTIEQDGTCATMTNRPTSPKSILKPPT